MAEEKKRTGGEGAKPSGAKQESPRSKQEPPAATQEAPAARSEPAPAERVAPVPQPLENLPVDPVLQYLETIGGIPASPGGEPVSGSAEEILAQEKGIVTEQVVRLINGQKQLVDMQIQSPQYEVVAELERQLDRAPIRFAYEPGGCSTPGMDEEVPTYPLAEDPGDLSQPGAAPSLRLREDLDLQKALLEPKNQAATASAKETLTAALAQAKRVYRNAKTAAWATLQEMLEDWDMEVATYGGIMDTARLTLNNAVAEAKTTYVAPDLHPAPSTQQTNYYTMKVDATAALLAYEQARQKAANKLMSALTVLLAACTTYRGAVMVAKATKLNADAVARQAYWSAVRGILTGC